MYILCITKLEVQMWTCDGEPGQRWAHDPATGQVHMYICISYL